MSLSSMEFGLDLPSSDSANLCAAHPCSICWPSTPLAQCNMPTGGIYNNLVLRNITINSPKLSAGVLMGSSEHPMQNVVFEDVKVNNPNEHGHWGPGYYVTGIDASTCVAKGTTSPVPKGFKDATDSVKSVVV